MFANPSSEILSNSLEGSDSAERAVELHSSFRILAEQIASSSVVLVVVVSCSLDSEVTNILCIAGVKNEVDCTILAKLGELFSSADVACGREHFLLNPPDNGLLSTITVEVDLCSIDEEEDGGIAAHSVVRGTGRILSGINFGKLNIRAFGSKFLSSCCVGRCQSLAVTAPWSIELDEDVVELGKNAWEVSIVKYQDFLLNFIRTSVHQHDCQDDK